jgi:hypothetical protein
MISYSIGVCEQNVAFKSVFDRVSLGRIKGEISVNLAPARSYGTKSLTHWNGAEKKSWS